MSLALLIKNGDEDAVQEAICKALSKTDVIEQAHTIEEFVRKYEHLSRFIMHIYKHERINQFRNGQHVPLTELDGVVYTRENLLEGCSEEELEAISYYLAVVRESTPLTAAQRAKLKRLRKQTGLALSTKGV